MVKTMVRYVESEYTVCIWNNMFVNGVNIGAGTEKKFTDLQDARKYAYQLVMLNKSHKYADRYLGEERGFVKTRIFAEISKARANDYSVYYGKLVETGPIGVYLEIGKWNTKLKEYMYEYRALDENGRISKVLMTSQRSVFWHP